MDWQKIKQSQVCRVCNAFGQNCGVEGSASPGANIKSKLCLQMFSY